MTKQAVLWAMTVWAFGAVVLLGASSASAGAIKEPTCRTMTSDGPTGVTSEIGEVCSCGVGYQWAGAGPNAGLCESTGMGLPDFGGVGPGNGPGPGGGGGGDVVKCSAGRQIVYGPAGARCLCISGYEVDGKCVGKQQFCVAQSEDCGAGPLDDYQECQAGMQVLAKASCAQGVGPLGSVTPPFSTEVCTNETGGIGGLHWSGCLGMNLAGKKCTETSKKSCFQMHMDPDGCVLAWLQGPNDKGKSTSISINTPVGGGQSWDTTTPPGVGSLYDQCWTVYAPKAKVCTNQYVTCVSGGR